MIETLRRFRALPDEAKSRECRIRVGRLAAAAGMLVVLFSLSVGIVISRSPIKITAWLQHPVASVLLSQGENPDPVQLVRPPVEPLSAMAQLGQNIFYDSSLSASGRLSCSSCHSPAHAYGPPLDLPAMDGGAQLSSQGVRAVPSLMYLERQPNFSIGPDDEENENVSLTQLVAQSQTAGRTTKTAQDTAQAAANLVPQGGLTWDGRADTLQQQAAIPLLSPFEMDNANIDAVAGKLRRASYAALIQELFGSSIFNDPRMVVSEAMFAVGRYQIEDTSFHPYTSKFDAWLEGKARMSPAEMRGYMLFNDPDKADCGGCHLDQPTADNQPPLFTDHQYEALGVPRNQNLAVNQNPSYYDLGICGPYRTDLTNQPQYCAMFLTPTLRNVAIRHVFFHNGVYHDLKQVMDFYDFRDTQPQRIYPHGAKGEIAIFNDIPASLRANVDHIDPPFNRSLGEPPAMSRQDENDIIAFLKTLTDQCYVGSIPARSN